MHFFHSSAHLLGSGVCLKSNQVCQVHRARHWAETAALRDHRVADVAIWAAVGRGDQRHSEQGKLLDLNVKMTLRLIIAMHLLITAVLWCRGLC